MLKQYTFLALALVGCAMLFLDHKNTSFGETSRYLWIAEHPHMSLDTHAGRQPLTNSFTSMDELEMAHAHAMLAKSRANSLSLSNGIAELEARVRASIGRLKAEECCWLNSLRRRLQGSTSSRTSPAWRDVQYDAQQLARMLGFCKQEPV